jgi:uncharacterized repeat protein (TIGR01451 family)
VTPSNRICICVPRFVVVRGETGLVGYESLLGPNATQGSVGQANIKKGLPSLQMLKNEQLEAMRGQLRPSGTVVIQGLDRLVRIEVLKASDLTTVLTEIVDTARVQRLTQDERLRLYQQMDLARELGQPYEGPRGAEHVQAGPEVVGRVAGVSIIGSLQGTRDLMATCNEAPRLPDKPLVLFKWADAQAAHIGDVVTMYLKYTNHGGQPITDVAVSDSLTGRLEYIPGSAHTDRDANFSTQQNEAGSVILHWDVTGSLLPGQSGVISFQVRVR